MLILGIESSCDETAAAVYCSQKGILSSVLFSQIELHKGYGGVIPEIASRAQLEKINPMVTGALDAASVTLDQIDAIAVTNKPGLAGSLLVGVCFAKALAFAKQKTLIGVNHLEGHAFSSFLEHNVPFPHLCLTASGGHTSLYLMHDFGKYDVLGATVDDAAGEAFDKVAKLMNLPYPGGPIIERLAAQVRFVDFFNYPRGKPNTLDFSFSGLKTAVLYDLIAQRAYDLSAKRFLREHDELFKQQVASSLLVAIADTFEDKIKLALKLHPEVKAVTLVGGVACNKYIGNRLRTYCESRAMQFYTPSAKYCTDNAAMIAFVGAYKLKQGLVSDYTLDIF